MRISETLKKSAIVFTAISTISGGGWWAATTLATTSDIDAASDRISVAENKANYAIDMHIQSLHAQLARLQAKKTKTRDDYEQIRYLRDEIKRLRAVRAGGQS